MVKTSCSLLLMHILKQTPDVPVNIDSTARMFYHFSKTDHMTSSVITGVASMRQEEAIASQASWFGTCNHVKAYFFCISATAVTLIL